MEVKTMVNESAVTMTEPQKPRNIQIDWQGLPIMVEYFKGDFRKTSSGYTSHVDAPYGYIEKTVSTEPGEELDVFLGEDMESPLVFLAALMMPDDRAALMENKILLGFSSYDEALKFIKGQYGDICSNTLLQMSMDDLKSWVEEQAVKAEKELPITVPIDKE